MCMRSAAADLLQWAHAVDEGADVGRHQEPQEAPQLRHAAHVGAANVDIAQEKLRQLGWGIEAGGRACDNNAASGADRAQ